jgi:hypothetical protein
MRLSTSVLSTFWTLLQFPLSSMWVSFCRHLAYKCWEESVHWWSSMNGPLLWFPWWLPKARSRKSLIATLSHTLYFLISVNSLRFSNMYFWDSHSMCPQTRIILFFLFSFFQLFSSSHASEVRKKFSVFDMLVRSLFVAIPSSRINAHLQSCHVVYL